MMKVQDRIDVLEKEMKELRTKYGYYDMEFVESIEGTNSYSYKCIKCGQKWVQGRWLPCPDCYPDQSFIQPVGEDNE